MLEQKLGGAENEVTFPRFAGDSVVGAFFSANKPRPRELERQSLRQKTETALKNPTDKAADHLQDMVARLRYGSKGIVPFHWEMEFPEVFTFDEKGQETGGFDVIVGNPPFAGKNTLADTHAAGYIDWLKMTHEQSHGNADLVAHFFRRAFNILRKDGCFGLIATNTIGQGDTRSTGLRWICLNGGTIYRATKRLKWPGEAAVVVSLIHVFRGSVPGPYVLNGRTVDHITAYLFHAGGHEDPQKLIANEDKSFTGVFVLGMGFTFDDEDAKGDASPIAEMERVISRDDRNRQRIFPYIGGEEINDSPTHAHSRYVINFETFPLRREHMNGTWLGVEEGVRKQWLQHGTVPADYPGPVAADWPDLLEII